MENKKQDLKEIELTTNLVQNGDIGIVFHFFETIYIYKWRLLSIIFIIQCITYINVQRNKSSYYEAESRIYTNISVQFITDIAGSQAIRDSVISELNLKQAFQIDTMQRDWQQVLNNTIKNNLIISPGAAGNVAIFKYSGFEKQVCINIVNSVVKYVKSIVKNAFEYKNQNLNLLIQKRLIKSEGFNPSYSDTALYNSFLHNYILTQPEFYIFSEPVNADSNITNLVAELKNKLIRNTFISLIVVPLLFYFMLIYYKTWLVYKTKMSNDLANNKQAI